MIVPSRKCVCLLLGGVALLAISAFLTWVVRDEWEANRYAQCKGKLKQLGLALFNYHEDYGSFPPAYIADTNGNPMHSWRLLLLPYMDEPELYSLYNFSQPWNAPGNSKLSDTCKGLVVRRSTIVRPLHQMGRR